MKSLKSVLTVLVCAVFLAACAQRQSQNVYNHSEVGKSSAVSFGTVVASRVVDVTGENSGAGALVGAAAGAGAGSYIGSGSGEAWAVGAGLLVGAVAGAMAEQAMNDRQGIEYVVTLESGVTLTIVQEIGEGESQLPPGARVMVQNSGGYQRVLPADHLPTQINRPQGIQVVDP
ncbi:hypothetical protein [Tepidicaulis sp.]|uniref:outer membrane lipoprotein n=1 Tax=Tepidicaulis sp. TaxID=1920809 RepID=UPI003B59A73A